MVIEASLIAGYVIKWVVGKVRRAGGGLDETVDAAIDAGLERLHASVVAKIGSPTLEDLEREAAAGAEVSELTRQRIELDLLAAGRDEQFAAAVNELAEQVRSAERAAGIVAGGSGAAGVIGDGAVVFTGDAHATAGPGGLAIGQAGHVHATPQVPPDPSRPGR